jgi:hypothetical protein
VKALRALLLVGALVPGAVVPSPAAAQEDPAPGEATAPGEAALSPRNASYTIDVRLEPETRMLHGTQRLTWTNTQDGAADRLWFHLYWNGWRNRHSTWMREERLRGRAARRQGGIENGDWSYIEVESVKLASGADITRTLYFAFPDDGNVEDRTAMVVLLPQPVEPGQSIGVDMTWRAKIPRTFARTGFRGDAYFFSNWFPAVGVFGLGGWNNHQFHAGTEFFSDYGVYDVSMTVPADYVLGATGVEVERRDNGDGTVTHRYEQADVHTFAWTTSPEYLVVEDRFEAADLPPVDLRLLLQPDHFDQADRHLEATRAALLNYGTWYGPYPYGHLTIVDPAYGLGAGGMEYPTLFTAGSRWFNPEGGDGPEHVTIHEAGHQFWYGIVGNNEFESAWLDEGLNTFSTERAAMARYGESRHSERFFSPPGAENTGFFALLVDGFDYGGRPLLGRLARYRQDATSDPQSRPSYRYHPRRGGSLSYSKTALWLQTLENWIGWEDGLQPILSTFFARWKFAHPTADDFVAVANELTEQDIDGFLREVMGSEAFDYAVDSVATFPTANEGWVKTGSDLTLVEPAAGGDGGEPAAADAAGTLYRSEVVVERRGGGTFPVDVLLVFEDGHEIRHHWEGRQRWYMFTEEYPSRLAYAVVDPDGVLALDLRPTNNSMQVVPEPELPAWKWAARWTVWLQDFLATFGSFV